MSQWPPSDPSPQPPRDPSPQPRDPSPDPRDPRDPRDPSPQPPPGPPRVETYEPQPTAPAAQPVAPPEPVAPETAPASPVPPTAAEPREATVTDAPEPEDSGYDAPPLADPAPPEPASYEDAPEYGDNNVTDGEDVDETVFELNDLSLEQRRHLDMRLTGARIVHRWEVGSDLVVNTPDADAIEAFLDEVENPDAFELSEMDEFGDDVDDEAVYKAMSDLYVAADRLQHAADDSATAGSFHLAADGVVDAPPPFGFDPRLWAQVKELTASVVASLDADAEPDVVEQDARTLRQILANYV